MNTGRDQMKPRARTEDIVVQTLPDEVLVYDLKRHEAHCLNPTAALVWKHCDGQTTAAQLAQILQQAMRVPVPEEVVWLGLQQLHKARLLTEREHTPASEDRISRREVVRRLGWATAAALPLVTSIVTPTASEAASCLASGAACTTGAQCCSGVCLAFTCI
jgi:Coenzyme PQQ synthesis protein D (PqqD)